MSKHLQIREEDIAAYQRDGAVVLRGVLDPPALARLETGVEEAYHNRDSRHTVVRSPSGAGETLVRQYPSQSSPALGELVASGVPGQIAARMMGTPSAQLVLDQIFYKSAGHIAPTPWHQDTPFLRVRGDDLIRVWLCCDPSPADLTVQMVRGSHRWNVVYNTQTMAETTVFAERRGDFQGIQLGDAHLPLVPDVAGHPESFDVLAFDVQPGDALVFQGNVLHGAGGHENFPHGRRAFASLWGGPQLRYHRSEGKTFPPPGGEPPEGKIADGAMIGQYEAAFPVGWREG